jgi:hypothetical protein
VELGVLEAGGARERAAGLLGQAVQGGGRVLERLALEQLGEQQVALLPEAELVVEVDVTDAGEQAPALELHQGGGDEEELGGHLEVEPPVGEWRSRSVSERKASMIVLIDTSYRSTCSRMMRWSSRSKGPSNTGVRTS